MIKSSDLRIGNFVMDEVSGEWMVVEELTKKNIVTTVINRSKYPLPDGWQITGIRLTREILKQFGFEDKGNNVFAQENIEIGCGKTGVNWIFYFEHHLSVPVMSYLHQLQNLYHLLIGQELEIKELATQ